MEELKELNLSVRSYNALKKAGIINKKQILNLTEEELKNIRGLGTKSLEELEDLRRKSIQEMEYTPELIELSKILFIPVEEVLNYLKEYENIENMINFKFENRMIEYFENIISLYPYGLTKKTLFNNLPKVLQNEDILENYIVELEYYEIIKVVDEYINIKNRKSLVEELKIKIKDDKKTRNFNL